MVTHQHTLGKIKFSLNFLQPSYWLTVSWAVQSLDQHNSLSLDNQMNPLLYIWPFRGEYTFLENLVLKTLTSARFIYQEEFLGSGTFQVDGIKASKLILGTQIPVCILLTTIGGGDTLSDLLMDTEFWGGENSKSLNHVCPFNQWNSLPTNFREKLNLHMQKTAVLQGDSEFPLAGSQHPLSVTALLLSCGSNSCAIPGRSALL